MPPGCHGNPPHTETNGTRRNGTGTATVEKDCKSAPHHGLFFSFFQVQSLSRLRISGGNRLFLDRRPPARCHGERFVVVTALIRPWAVNSRTIGISSSRVPNGGAVAKKPKKTRPRIDFNRQLARGRQLSTIAGTARVPRRGPDLSSSRPLHGGSPCAPWVSVSRPSLVRRETALASDLVEAPRAPVEVPQARRRPILSVLRGGATQRACSIGAQR